jgi:CubicO group peptidase (beta-lactamase class C family)
VVREYIKDNGFTGTVLVADKGEIIYNQSFGDSDHQSNTRNSDTTRFLIGSVSKPLTAILVLKLVAAGKLKFDDTIGNYFPQSDPSVAAITIHQLLTHTSGIGEIINKENDMDLDALINNAKLSSDKHNDFEYSNSGYVILKEIAERVTAKDYRDLLEEEVFGPARMKSSGVASENMDMIAKGYEDAHQNKIVSLDFPIQNVNGAGSIYSTTRDLYKLDSVLYTDVLLASDIKSQMLKQHVPEKYSYGWFVRERGGVWDVYWHSGDLPGFHSFMSRRVEKKQLIVILSNAEGGDLSDLENSISRILKSAD